MPTLTKWQALKDYLNSLEVGSVFIKSDLTMGGAAVRKYVERLVKAGYVIKFQEYVPGKKAAIWQTKDKIPDELKYQEYVNHKNT